MKILLLLLFLSGYFVTSPEYIGDTIFYVTNTLDHDQGLAARYWEFGHLLWRPWAHTGNSMLGAWIAQTFGDTPMQAVVRFLMATNFICSIASVLLLFSVLRKLVQPWIALVVMFAMICSSPFLNYSHSGTAYVPGLAFSALTMYLLVEAMERPLEGWRYAILAGCSFALACALWFPYSFTGLGMTFLPLLWPLRNADSAERPYPRQLIAAFLISLVFTAVLLFAAGAMANGIGSAADLRRWILDSDNGWEQSRNAMRAVTGVARSTWNLGQDGVLMKRFLFADPYNPVRLWNVALTLGNKLALFYLGIMATIWILWHDNRRILWLLAAGLIPLLLFAIFLFEPSSPERFLPAFPFLYLAFAAALDKHRRHILPAACVMVLLVGSAIVNLAQDCKFRDSARLIETEARFNALVAGVQAGALVFTVTGFDDLFYLPLNDPLNRSWLNNRFSVTDLVAIATARIPKWRMEFAQRVEDRWAKDQEVWLSERMLAARPEARWLWVEGDDRRMTWREVPETMRQFAVDSTILAGHDGFVRLARNDANRELLTKFGQANK